MIEFLLGIILANMMEWIIHRYVLHGLGKKRNSFWKFHWHDHHQVVRKNNFYDFSYHEPIRWNSHGKELFGLILINIIFSPLFLFSVYMSVGAIFSTVLYYIIHRYCHLNPEWAKKYTPWHYDHHMGKNQDKNWCVTFPLFDYIMNTRVKYK